MAGEGDGYQERLAQLGRRLEANGRAMANNRSKREALEEEERQIAHERRLIEEERERIESLARYACHKAVSRG